MDWLDFKMTVGFITAVISGALSGLCWNGLFSTYKLALSIFVYSNYTEEINFASKIWPYYAIPFEYGIPLLLWVVAKIRRY